jgi:sulfite exporter TauE/SafE
MFEFLSAVCGIGVPAASGLATVLALGLAGLLGGAGHCSLMCGPFVLAQVADRFAAGATDRLGTALLLPYQAGRLLTYAGLGAVAGGLGSAVAWLAEAPWLMPGALLLAAFVFALQGLGLVRIGGQGWPARALARRRGRGLGLGLALGFLPCGLVYGALIAASGAGSAPMGALALAAFGLGTVPALAAVGWLGLSAGRRWIAWARSAAPVLSLVNAGVLVVLAYRAM